MTRQVCGRSIAPGFPHSLTYDFNVGKSLCTSSNFITLFDRYAMRLFEVGGVDWLTTVNWKMCSAFNTISNELLEGIFSCPSKITFDDLLSLDGGRLDGILKLVVTLLLLQSICAFARRFFSSINFASLSSSLSSFESI